MKSLFEEYPTYEEFLYHLHPDNMVAAFKEIRTIGDSICKPRMTIADIDKLYGDNPSRAIDYLEKWLIMLNNSLGIPKKLGNVKQVAFMINDRFSALHLADLKLIFDKIMYGDDVRFYGAVDAQAILKAISDVNIERNARLNKVYSQAKQEVYKMRDSYDFQSKIKNSIHNQLLSEGCTKDEIGEAMQKRFIETIDNAMQKKWNELAAKYLADEQGK